MSLLEASVSRALRPAPRSLISPPKYEPSALGVVTALGSDARAAWQALIAGNRIVDHAPALLGETGSQSRCARLALAAADQAIVGLSSHDLASTALVVGTSKGPVEGWLKGRFHPQGLGEIADVVASQFGVAGPRLTVSAACASGLHALIRAALMIRAREAARVLVVAAEASLHPLFIGSFQRLGVLPPAGVGCKPFDQHRAGFVMSEAAAALMLEAVETNGSSPLPRIRHTPLVIDRMALAGDPSHLTHSDPDGRIVRSVLRRVADGSAIDLVHAHGTGTLANDPIELSAIDDIVDGRPTVYSHKGALGHSLGASGLLEVVINCLCHQHGVVPPNVATTDPLPAQRLELSSQPVRRDIHTSIALAAGFGGAIAAIRLRNAEHDERYIKKSAAFLNDPMTR